MKAVGEVHGDRPHLQAGVAEGAARARDRPRRLGHRRTACRMTACADDSHRHAARRAAPAHRGAAVPAQARIRCRASSVDEIHELTGIDPWFLAQLRGAGRSGAVVSRRWTSVDARRPAAHEAARLQRPAARAAARRDGDRASASARHALGVRPTYHMVDTCAGEFPAATPYLYSSYEDESEAPPTRSQEDRHPRQRPEPHRPGHRVRLLLRAGRARAARGRVRDHHGQLEPGNRFDRLRHLRQAVLRAAHARGRARDRRAREAGRRDRAARRADAAQAGQAARRRSGVPILGTSVDAIDRAEDRDRFAELCRSIGATRAAERHRYEHRAGASQVAQRVGYPVLVRPSYVLGGRAMEIVYDEASLLNYFERAVRASPDHPVLIDRFLEDAFEADVDALGDGDRRRDRRRDAAHRGCRRALRRLRVRAAAVPAEGPRSRARCASSRASSRSELGVVGLINVQYADPRRRRLRARGEPARVAHRAVRFQGDRCAVRAPRRRVMGGANACPTSTLPMSRRPPAWR